VAGRRRRHTAAHTCRSDGPGGHRGLHQPDQPLMDGQPRRGELPDQARDRQRRTLRARIHAGEHDELLGHGPEREHGLLLRCLRDQRQRREHRFHASRPRLPRSWAPAASP
jgi:hypothetical protein